jgi:hypothetical protein
MSINIAHIIFEPPRTPTSQFPNTWIRKPQADESLDKYEPRGGAFRSVCSTICTTGDRRGEFWTCSFLGPFSAPEKNQQQFQGEGNRSKPSAIFDVNEIRNINMKYNFDKYSARNLVFVVQLTRLIWTLSGLYEDVAQHLRKILKLDV